MLLLAWKFIRYDRAKSIGIVTAVVISIFLIGQQLGILFYLMTLMGNLVGNAPIKDNQIWIIEGQSNDVNVLRPIDQRFVQEIASMPNVSIAHPVVVTQGSATFLDGKTAGVNIIGSSGPDFVIGPSLEKIHEGSVMNLMNPQAFSADFYNAKDWDTDLYKDKAIEINGKSAKISLITKNAKAFGASIMYTSLQNARLYGKISPHQVSIIVAELKDNNQKQQTIDEINELHPNLKAWDVQQLRSSTIKEILIASNMGLSFGILVVFAIIAGFFIIGLTLYSSALDRIKDYGTLKAIGAKNNYVNRLIIAQAFLYAIIGYSIALLLLFGFKFGAASGGLIIDISLPLATFLLLLTLVISIGGSLFAVRKIAKLEPASVF